MPEWIRIFYPELHQIVTGNRFNGISYSDGTAYGNYSLRTEVRIVPVRHDVGNERSNGYTGPDRSAHQYNKSKGNS